MKKIFVLILALMLVFALCISAGAEEVVPGGELVGEGEVIPEEVPEEAPQDEPVAELQEETILTRIFELWEDNKEEIQSLGGLLITAIFGFILKHIKSGINKKIDDTSTTSTAKTNELVEAYNATVKVVGLLCEKVDTQNRKIDELQAQLAEVGKHTLEAEEIEESIAKILTTAYAGSALDNGTKEMINLECARIINKLSGNTAPEAEADEKQD